MQAVLDLLPVAAFVVTYYAAGFYAATAVLMIAMLALLVVDYLRLRRIPPLHLLSAALVLTLGGTTLLLHDVRFLKWKPTVFLWLVAIAAIGSTWYGRAPLAQRLLQPMVEGSAGLPRALWLRLNWSWAGFYLLLGSLNLWVAYSASERTWVNFKFFGLTSALVLFAVAQALWLSARLQAAPAPLA